MKPRVLYFGCWSRAQRGHYLHEVDGRTGRPLGIVPFVDAELDGGFCPEGQQSEGVARLHHLRGWTVLAFWDRSADSRGNSHSTFLADGQHEFEEMVALAKEAFPAVWARFGFTPQKAETETP